MSKSVAIITGASQGIGQSTAFPKEAGIARYGEPNRRTDGIPGVAGSALDDRLDASDGWRRGQVDLRPIARAGTRHRMRPRTPV